MNRTEWLRERQTGVGGTDIASICGVGFRTAAEVYEEKVAAEPEDRPPSPIMAMGNVTEEYNAALYSARSNAQLFSPGLVRSRKTDWLFATYDRVTLEHDEPGRKAVELKYAGPFFGDKWGDEGTDHVPEGYIVQTTWETLVLRENGFNPTTADLSALCGTGEHRVYTIPFDARLAEYLFLIGLEFWQRVKRREPVGPDWRHPLTDTVANHLAAIRPDTTVELGPDAAECVAEIDHLTDVKRRGESAEDSIKVYKQKLRELLGGAQVGRLPDGRRVKQSLIPGKLITPEPYLREPRVQVNILKAPSPAKSKGR